MRRADRLAPAAVIGWALVACVVPGCQVAYEYEVRGTIKDFPGGAPLGGVRVELAGASLFIAPEPTVSGSDGSFRMRFSASDGDLRPNAMAKWSLLLVKAGYQDELVDIGPSEEPESPSAIQRIVVLTYMRAKSAGLD